MTKDSTQEAELLCGNASDNLYLTFKGGCRDALTYKDAYRCTGCGGRFHKDCILKHFELEKEHDWGRQQERLSLLEEVLECAPEKKIKPNDVHIHGQDVGYDQAIDQYKANITALLTKKEGK